MEFQSRGYETHKEFPSEERSVHQNIFSTIEFGFSPFVPFSKDYGVYSGKLGNGFGVHVSSPPPEEEDWGLRLQEYQDARGKTGGPMKGMAEPGGMPGLQKRITLDVENAPQADIQNRAELMSRQITLMLEQEGIAKEFDTGVREEVEGRSVALMLMDSMNNNQIWRDPNVNEQIELASDDLSKLGGETFDLYADTEDNRKVLEYNLHMIARQLGLDGPEFVKGVRAMETTTMMQEKRFQAIMRDNFDTSKSVLENFEAAVNTGLQELLDTYFTGKNKTMKAVYDAIGKQEKGKGSETLPYFARQMLSRFMGIESGGLGMAAEGYIFQAPVSKNETGVAVIRPHIKGGKLVKPFITAAVGVIGGESFGKLMEAGHKDDVKVFEMYTKQTFASNAQLLLWDYQQMTKKNDAEIFALAQAGYAPVVNRMAQKGETGLTLGSSLAIEMQQSLGNTVQSSGRVQAVEVIGSSEAAKLVQKQVQAFFLDPGVRSSFEKFYKDAMDQSADVTNTWRNKIGAGGYTVTANRGGIYARDGGPYVGNKGDALEGIGIPFWFLIGRDPTGFEKFRDKESHSAAKFAAAARKDPTKKQREAGEPGTFIPMAERGVLMKGGHLKGRRMAVRNPQKNYIVRTWRKSKMQTYSGYEQTPETYILHDKYMELDWRKEIGGTFGSAGVMQEDMSEVEAVLAKSRVGGV